MDQLDEALARTRQADLVAALRRPRRRPARSNAVVRRSRPRRELRGDL